MLTVEARELWRGVFWSCVGADNEALVRHVDAKGNEFAVFEFATIDKGYSVFADANAAWLDKMFSGNRWYSVRPIEGKWARAVCVDDVMHQEWMDTTYRIIEVSRMMSGDDCPDNECLNMEKQCWRAEAWMTYLSDSVREKFPAFPIDEIEYKEMPSAAYSLFRMWAEMTYGVYLAEEWMDGGLFIDIDGLLDERGETK